MTTRIRPVAEMHGGLGCVHPTEPLALLKRRRVGEHLCNLSKRENVAALQHVTRLKKKLKRLYVKACRSYKSL